jgi:hypothetical protein
MPTRHVGKLGKQEARIEPRTLCLESYLPLSRIASLPPAHDETPATVNPWPDWLNCNFQTGVPAAVGNAVLSWHALAGQAVAIPDEAVLAFYSAVSGFDPTTGSPDSGCPLIDAMLEWQQRGFDGHRIDTFLTVPIFDSRFVRYCVCHLGGVIAGLALSLRARQQFGSGKPWIIGHNAWGVDRPGCWGGQAAWVQRFDAQGPYFRVWRELQPASWFWWETCCDEAFVPISFAWLESRKRPLPGFDLKELQSDLAVR